jgi:hypothetical protein
MKTFLNNLNGRYISNIHLCDKNLCHYMLRPSLNHREAGKVKFISATLLDPSACCKMVLPFYLCAYMLNKKKI